MRNDKLAAFDESAQKSSGSFNPMMIQNADIDRYMQERDTSEHANVKRAKDFEWQLIEYFNVGSVFSGASLPWPKTHETLRLRPAEVTLWSGFNGHGKSLVLGQVMLHLLKEQKVCIASFEMKPTATLARMCRQALGSNSPTDDYVRRFCDKAAEKLWLYDQQGTVTPKRLISVVQYAAEVLGVQHFVIDSLMKCGINDDDYNGQKRFIDSLCAVARDTGCHIHLVAHSRKGQDELSQPSKMDVKGSGSITDQVDNVLTVWRNKPKENLIAAGKADAAKLNQPDTYIICDKQRHGEWEGNVGLWFDKAGMRFMEQKVNPALIRPIE